MYEIMHGRHGRIQRGTVGTDPLEKITKNIGFFCNTGPNP